MNITEVKIIKLQDSKTLALVNITIDDEFVVSGLKILEGANGLWVAYPNRKDAKGEYRDIAFPITKEARQTIQDKVLAKYQPNEMYEDVKKGIDKHNGGLDVQEDDLPF